METPRTQVEKLRTDIGSYMSVLRQGDGTTPEYMATLVRLSAALSNHNNITLEIGALGGGGLGVARAALLATDNMIVNFIKEKCEPDTGHPGALVNHLEPTAGMTNRIEDSNTILEEVLRKYKEANGRS